MEIKKNIYKLKGLISTPVVGATTNGMPNLETAHNIRFLPNGGIESVCNRPIVDEIVNDNKFEIIYHHSQINNGNYIATKDTSIYFVEIKDKVIVEKSLLSSFETAAIMQDVEVYSFGTILYLTRKGDGRVLWEKSFQWYTGKYHDRDFEQVAPPLLTNVVYDRFSSPNVRGELPSLAVTVNLDKSQNSGNGKHVVTSYDYHYKSQIDKFVNSNYIYGTVYLIFAYKLVDGTIIKHSSINMMDSQEPSEHNDYSIFYNEVNNALKFHVKLCGIKPTLSFNVPQEVKDNPLIDSILIYSCRNSSFYDFDNLYDKFNFQDLNRTMSLINGVVYTRISARSIIDKTFVKVAHTPFYKIAELHFREKETIELTFKENYDGIELKEIFQPNMSSHSLKGFKKFEYNSRIHLLGVDMKFYDGEIISCLSSSCPVENGVLKDNVNWPGTLIFRIRILDDLDNGFTYAEYPSKLYSSSIEPIGSYVVLPNMITYPDIRAESIDVSFRSSSGIVYDLDTLKLEKAPENGYAYWQNINVDKLNCYFSFQLEEESMMFQAKTHVNFEYPNRIAVSEIGNSFVFNYKNIIDINGRDTVINMVSAINQNITDMVFGQYPLYVFTSKGIFAVEQGTGGVVYSKVVPINSHITSQISDCASNSESVFFTTEQGLFFIKGVNVVDVSDNVRWYSYDSVRFVDYLKSAKIIFDQFYNEVLICNDSYEYCYVYSILAKEFTTRDYDFSVIQKDLVLTYNGICSIRTSEMPDKPKYSLLVTKGDSFGTSKRKRIKNFEIMGMFSNEAKIQFYGSNDCVSWKAIKAVIANEQKFKKALGSWRYLRFAVASNYLSIDNFEIDVEVREL